MNAKGKYWKACNILREELKADAVFLIVVNGSKGSGASFECALNKMELAHTFPEVLRQAAKGFEKDLQENAQNQN